MFWRSTPAILLLLVALLLSCSGDDGIKLNQVPQLQVCGDFTGCDTTLGGGVAPVSGGLAKPVPTSYSLDLCWTSADQSRLVATVAIPAAGHLILDLRNQLGSVIDRLADDSVEAGYYPLCRDTDDLSAGVYSVYVESGDFHLVRQFRFDGN